MLLHRQTEVSLRSEFLPTRLHNFHAFRTETSPSAESAELSSATSFKTKPGVQLLVFVASKCNISKGSNKHNLTCDDHCLLFSCQVSHDDLAEETANFQSSKQSETMCAEFFAAQPDLQYSLAHELRHICKYEGVTNAGDRVKPVVSPLRNLDTYCALICRHR